MSKTLLVASQVSSFALPAQDITLTSNRRQNDLPLPPTPKDSDPPSDHAIHAALLHTPLTGSLALRVLDGGMVVELMSLSTNVNPLRFVFEAPVLPKPALFLWENELHVLAVTTAATLHRIVLPVYGGLEVWQEQGRVVWQREYLIQTAREELAGPVHVQGTHCVAVGMRNGSLLRLEATHLGMQGADDEWRESVKHPGHKNYFSTLTSLLHQGNAAESAHIVSMTSLPFPTDIEDIWTLSRDRTLRLWTATQGCIAARTLFTSSREPTPNTLSKQPLSLLDAEPQNLIRAFSVPIGEDEENYVLVFLPTPSGTTGGVFQLLNARGHHLETLATFSAPKQSAHCHLQDFVVADGTTLYTLWDRQGRSVVEHLELGIYALSQGETRNDWHTSSYAQEVELTPAYLEEVLLLKGALTDKFFELIMRPGIFSPLTLRTAIAQYVRACQSLPGVQPAPLRTAYGSVGEQIAGVVGCTVSLTRDPQTGAFLHENYRNALKRDWEGFIARCREIERSARRPIAIGCGPTGEMLYLERERIGALTKADACIEVSRSLAMGRSIGHDVLSVAFAIYGKLGPKTVIDLEDSFVDFLRDDVEGPLADYFVDLAGRINFEELEADDEALNQFDSRLTAIDDLPRALIRVLEDLETTDALKVKTEEEEVALLLPVTSQSNWIRSLSASYITNTASARYDLALLLITLLHYLADDLWKWDSTLLARTVAVFRSLVLLRYVTRQPNSTLKDSPVAEATAAEDVVEMMRNMQMSRSDAQNQLPPYSLTFRLLAQAGDHTPDFYNAAHRYLEDTGILESLTPADATEFEVQLCDQVRVLGYGHAANELLSWLPRTPAVNYVLARVWLNIGRRDDACQLLEKLAGSFGPQAKLRNVDRDALASVLPEKTLFISAYEFYLHASMLAKANLLVFSEVGFTQLALSVAPPGEDTVALWQTAIKGYSELGMYDDAYAVWVAAPSEELKRDSISYLVYLICEDTDINAVDQLMTYNFAGFADEVEKALSFKARNVDPRLRPNYSRILYSWYTLRGDYRNAAMTMYQRARKYDDLFGDNPQLLVQYAEEELEAYMITMNSLSLVDSKNAWFLMRWSANDVEQPRKRRKLTKYIPEEKYSAGKYDAELVTLDDIQYKYTLLSAQLDVIRLDPTLMNSSQLLVPPEAIVMRLAQNGYYDVALSTGKSLKVNMSDLFGHLTARCLRASYEEEADWLYAANVPSWAGASVGDRAWRFLRQSLERSNGPTTDWEYWKVVYEVLVTNQKERPPKWLISVLETNDPEYLIRTSLRFEQFEYAVEYALGLLRKADKVIPKTSGSTWLPYTLLDQVVEVVPPTNSSKIQELRDGLSTRVKRMGSAKLAAA